MVEGQKQPYLCCSLRRQKRNKKCEFKLLMLASDCNTNGMCVLKLNYTPELWDTAWPNNEPNLIVASRMVCHE